MVEEIYSRLTLCQLCLRTTCFAAGRYRESLTWGGWPANLVPEADTDGYQGLE